MLEEKILEGGRNGISVTKGIVTRPASPWTATVHNYLNFMIENTDINIPKPMEYNLSEGYEKVGFVQGDSFNYPLPQVFYTNRMIKSAAQTLKSLHDASKKYIETYGVNHCWMLSPVEPFEVICHGDFAPYNVAISEGSVVGVFDFDTIHPGPIVRDLAYAIYRFVPVMNSEIVCREIDENEIFRRIDLFLHAYGYPVDKTALLNTMILRIESLIEYMKLEAGKSNAAFINNIEEGHLQSYQNDIELICKLKDIL